MIQVFLTAERRFPFAVMNQPQLSISESCRLQHGLKIDKRGTFLRCVLIIESLIGAWCQRALGLALHISNQFPASLLCLRAIVKQQAVKPLAPCTTWRQIRFIYTLLVRLPGCILTTVSHFSKPTFWILSLHRIIISSPCFPLQKIGFWQELSVIFSSASLNEKQ